MSGGFNNMLHFVGVVEDNHDRTNAGRVRVRAFGIHPPRVSEDIEDNVPTSDLPWATVLDGTYGVSPVIPSVGDWVFGFFIDGREAQQPMIIGRLPGMHMNMPGGTGESGEDGYLPPESVHNYGKPELHRYQGGEDMDKGQTLIQRASQELDINQAPFDEEEVFSEPPIAMPENNLNNRVFASKTGDNFIVMGDGSENESSDYILMSHSSGSVFQIDPNGTIFVKSFGDQYNTTDGVLSTYVTGSSHTNIQEDYTLMVEGGSGKVYVNGDLDIECENFNVTARSNMNLHAGVKTNISCSGLSVLAHSDDINMGAKGNMKFATGDKDTLGGFYIQALKGDFHVDSYKSNMFTESYTKISSKGVPCVSDQLLPYADSGHHGIEMNTPDIIHLDSGSNMSFTAGGLYGVNSVGNASIKTDANFHAHAGGDARISAENTAINALAGQADMTATGTANIESGGFASVDGNKVYLGSGTSARSSLPDDAVTAVTTQEGARNPQKDLKDARISVQEIATVVSPGELPKSKANKPPVIKRTTPFITGLMDIGD